MKEHYKYKALYIANYERGFSKNAMLMQIAPSTD